jgi:hypothetical protein
MDESLGELALRMTAYRERAAEARRLAEAISDKGATTSLIEHAQEFEKQAEAIAAEIIRRAHGAHDETDSRGAAAQSSRPEGGSR